MKNIKRIGALLLAIAMMLSMMSVTAFAEETAEVTLYQETNPYVYSHVNPDDTPDEWDGRISWYFSPHGPLFVWEDGTEESGITTVITLWNRVEQEMIKTYCLDLRTPAVKNSEYRRLNLEDSTYFSKENAEHLRAVFLNGFIDPAYTSDLQTAANEWLASQGKEQIVDLTSSQALSATQYAIWFLAGEDAVVESSAYYQTISPKDSWLAAVRYTDDPNPKETVVTDEDGNNITEKNVTLFAEYLLNLEGVAPSTVLVSDATLADATAGNAVLESDGTYSVTVTTNIDGVKEGDELYLTAAVGDKTDAGYEKSNTVAVTASGAQTVTLTGLTEEEANGSISVEINGTQTGADVYLYDSTGNRGASQTLIGYDTSVMPVQAKALIGEEERVLKIYKTTPADEEGVTTPLPNIQFIIYQVATTAQIESGEVVVGATPSDSDVTNYATLENEVVTITTDENGYAEYNFSRNGMPDGVYMVVERPTGSVQTAIDPFYISVPMTNDTGDGYIYEIVAYPKNEIITEEPAIDKDVTSLGQDSDTKDVGETVTWIINSYIPTDIADGISYVITDDVDSRLGAPSNIVVNVASAAAVDVLAELIAGTDYTAAVEAIAEGGNTLTVALTADGMSKVAEAVGENAADYVIRVTFDTVLTTSAVPGENIPNDATVDYTNSVGFEFTKESEEVEVHTGGLQISKVNDSGEALEGATFKIVRAATEAEIADETIEKIEIDGMSYVYVDFYMTADMSGEKVYEVTTDENGNAVIYGLAYGDYKIIETVAPTGYNLLRNPVDVEISAVSHLAENSIEVVNINKFTLPATGGIGTTIFIVTGLILIGAAVVLVLVSKKKKV